MAKRKAKGNRVGHKRDEAEGWQAANGKTPEDSARSTGMFKRQRQVVPLTTETFGVLRELAAEIAYEVSPERLEAVLQEAGDTAALGVKEASGKKWQAAWGDAEAVRGLCAQLRVLVHNARVFLKSGDAVRVGLMLFDIGRIREQLQLLPFERFALTFKENTDRIANLNRKDGDLKRQAVAMFHTLNKGYGYKVRAAKKAAAHGKCSTRQLRRWVKESQEKS